MTFYAEGQVASFDILGFSVLALNLLSNFVTYLLLQSCFRACFELASELLCPWPWLRVCAADRMHLRAAGQTRSAAAGFACLCSPRGRAHVSSVSRSLQTRRCAPCHRNRGGCVFEGGNAFLKGECVFELVSELFISLSSECT